MNKLITTIISALFLIGAFLVLDTAIAKQEKAECLRWAHTAQEHSQTWYATRAERAQCEAVGLPLPQDGSGSLIYRMR